MEPQKSGSKVNLNRLSHRFTKLEKKEAVALVEAGHSCKEVLSRYDISNGTLNKWRSDFSELAPPRKRKIYSPAYMRSVVRAVEQGMGISQAAIAFGVCNAGTVRRWIKKAKAENAELVSIEMKKEPQKKAVDKDLETLRQLLAESELRNKALETLIDVAEEQLKIDIRKKSGAKQSPK